MALVLVACGIPLGLAARRRLSLRLPRLVRGYTVLLIAPVAFAAGLLFVPRFSAVAAMAALIVAEAAGVWIGGVVNRARGGGLVSVTASSSNTGIWSLPIAGLFLGPGAVAFVAVFDQMSFPRGLLLTSRLRRFAPVRQATRTALADYAPASALVAGLALHAGFGRPDALAEWLPRAGLVTALVNMVLIGASFPRARPTEVHARQALLGAVFRFVPGVAALTLLQLAGVHPPAAAWLLAFAPSYYSMLPLSRLYGYDAREAIATAATTTLLAALALPFVLAALR
jgi:predicted permease